MTERKQHNYKHILGMSTTIAFMAALGMYNQQDKTPTSNEAITHIQQDTTNDPIETIAESFEQQAQQRFDITTENGHTISFPSQETYLDYTLLQDITKSTFSRYNGQRVPQDLRESALFAQRTIGVPHNILFMIAQAESRFNGNSDNPHSTGNGYFHLLKDPMFEILQKTIGTPLEHLFPLAKDIVRKEYNGGSYFYLTNSETGEIDKPLTMAYHEQISKDPFLSTITASLKIIDDKNILRHTSFRNETTALDSYAQYFYGGHGGKRYAILRREEPDAPVWRIYGTDQSTVLRQKQAEIENEGNRDFFFNRSTGDFKTVQEHVDYLRDRRDIPDTQWSLLDADIAFAENLQINNQKNILPMLIAQWEEKLDPTVQVALLKQEVN